MKRRLKCGTCNTRINNAKDVNGTIHPRPLTITGGENHVMLHTMNVIGECWDCGEKRREAEEKKRQTHLSRLMDEE